MAFFLHGPDRGWRVYLVAAIAGIGAGAVAAVALTRLPPLTTHRITTELNSAATTLPTPVANLSNLPDLLTLKAKEPWAVVGGSLLQSGLPGLAVSAFERAIAKDQTNTTLRVALGEALALSDNGEINERARIAFESALQSDPNDLVARFYMARWMLQNGRPKPALVKLVGLMRTVGNDPLWYERLWQVMPQAAEQVGISRLTLEALCVAGM